MSNFNEERFLVIATIAKTTVNRDQVESFKDSIKQREQKIKEIQQQIASKPNLLSAGARLVNIDHYENIDVDANMFVGVVALNPGVIEPGVGPDHPEWKIPDAMVASLVKAIFQPLNDKNLTWALVQLQPLLTEEAAKPLLSGMKGIGGE